jgi:trehalose 6-phosphate phosphatase
MKNILSRPQRKLLRDFAYSNATLALDYDGTLAPIIDDPARASMRPCTRELLAEVTQLYKVIVVSGRAHHDALRRLRGIGAFEVIGNHGVEPWNIAHRYIPVVKRWVSELEGALAPLTGIVIENKNYSLAIHYRKAPDKQQARAAILKAAAALEEVRIIGGKQVTNLLPISATNRGLAVERERKRLQCDTTIYVGDDETDEDVFALGQPERLLAIRVGAKRGSAASYCITNQEAIDVLLRTLLEFRSAPAWRGRRSIGIAPRRGTD